MTAVDLRSDTVTRPTPAMKRAMNEAPLGDDVYGEDPTVNSLERHLAELTGMEAAMLAPTGTQSNLAALMAHCQRGDEYIVGQRAHTYRWEGGGAAVLGSIQPQPLEMDALGRLDLDAVVAAIKPRDVHFARSRLLCLEDTHMGQPVPLEYLAAATAAAKDHGLACHLDGARLFNATVQQQVPLGSITRHFDSVSLCLSKGLGTPVGSVLCGSKALVEEARRWRKVLGGGMRQAGILAAAGLYALEHHVQRLADDHANAAALGRGLAVIGDGALAVETTPTNMVFVTWPGDSGPILAAELAAKGIIVPQGPRARLVTHLDVDAAAIQGVIEAVGDFYHRVGLTASSR
ncbi:MAG: low-specificity L-threonine aldolase [Candidatus Competibacterales bacterium]